MHLEQLALIVDDDAIRVFVDALGDQFAGRVGLFLRIAGGRWDLLGPRP